MYLFWNNNFDNFNKDQKIVLKNSHYLSVIGTAGWTVTLAAPIKVEDSICFQALPISSLKMFSDYGFYRPNIPTSIDIQKCKS